MQIRDESYKIKLLTKLDILADEYANQYKAKNAVSYQDYLRAVIGFMTDSLPSDIFDFAQSYGLIRDGEELVPTKNITYAEAMQILVRAGGYSEKIPGNEDISAYWKVAGERKLTKGISIDGTQSITASDMLTLLYNALDAEITDYEYTGTGFNVNVLRDETILSRYRDIHELEGIVADNGETSLEGASKITEDEILIGEIAILQNGNYTTDYLGYHVRAFVFDDEGTYSLKYIEAYENTVYQTLSDDMISLEDDFSKLSFEDENKKGKNVRIDPAVKVIYNGEAYHDYTAEDFQKPNTNITLIDNDEDGVSDVISIHSYETVAVSYITPLDGKVVNKYSYDGALSNVDINPESEDYKVSIYYNGEKVVNPELKGWYILSIATAKGTDKPVRKVYISDTAVSGTLEACGSESYIIDDEEYMLGEAFLKAIAAGDKNTPEMRPGKKYTFYLDINGNIAGASAVADGSLEYAVMLKLKQSDYEEEDVTIKFMESAGDWYEAPLAKKVKLYNDTYEGKSLKASEIFEMLVDEDKRVTPQVVQLSRKTDGSVNLLKIAIATNEFQKDYLTKQSFVNVAFRWTTNMFGSDKGPVLYAASNFTVFNFPAEKSYEEDDYSVSTRIIQDRAYSVTAYNMNRFKTSDCFVMQATASGEEQDDLFLVSRVTQELDSDEQVKTVLYGRFGSYDEISITAKDDKIFNGVQKGDVLKISTDGQGRVVSKSFIYSVKQGYQSQMSVSYSGLASGRIIDVDDATKTILIDCDGTEYALKHSGRYVSKLNVYLNDKESKKSEMIDFTDIVIGDFVVANVIFADMADIIVIRNY